MTWVGTNNFAKKTFSPLFVSAPSHTAGEEVTYPEEFDYDAWHQVHQERVALFRRRCRETPPIFVDKGGIWNYFQSHNFFQK